jgi:hypothetical protein
VSESPPRSDDGLLRDVKEADLEVLFEAEHDPETVRRSEFTPRERHITLVLRQD